MTMELPADEKRVAQVADFIRRELAVFLDDHHLSPLSKALQERCPTYGNGLPDGERRLAILAALGLMLLAVESDLIDSQAGSCRQFE